MNIAFSNSNPLLGGVIVAEYVKLNNSQPIEITWGNESSTKINIDSQEIVCVNSNDIARIIARKFAAFQLYGTTDIHRTEIDYLLSWSLALSKSQSDFSSSIGYLNKNLAPLTYLVAKKITIADFVVFAALYENQQWQNLLEKNTAPSNLLRWFDNIKKFEAVVTAINVCPIGKTTKTRVSDNVSPSTNSPRAQEGKFVELPGAEMGKVVVRFPPEASGYLHIGHAKAALLNQYYQQAFQGKLIMRFDDTNPAKENVHFEKVILEDVAMLEIKPDLFTHTSQYFDLMLEYCEKLLKEGKAYADDTEPELMKQQREQKIDSTNRNNTYKQNLLLWEEMKKGAEKGQKCCIRAKIDMQSANGCMRDPTIYRCKNEPHPRTGDKYKVYPTYDFACPIVDSIENVTHTLRTMEYHDRDAQFYWFIEALGLRKPYIWEYSRLSMTNTVLSKRKLAWFVENRLVDGWDDPRFPTVRGVLRRGMTVEGLKQFIIAQGSSRSVVFMEWDKIWAFNKKVIDPIAPRYTAIDFNANVPVLVKDVKVEKVLVPKHPKNSEIGTKEIWLGPKVVIDLADAEQLKEGENTTFINWGNLTINKINRNNGKIVSVEATPNLENKDYKKTLKITWLAEVDSAPLTPVWCVYFDHIISKPLLSKDEDFKKYVGHDTKTDIRMLGDDELKKLKKGDIIQLQRRGFFKVDEAYSPISLHTGVEGAIVLFSIPDGHTKENPTAGIPKSEPSKQSIASNKETQKISLETKSAVDVNKAIVIQGDLIRNLKSQKAAKSDIDAAVKVLLELKVEYKTVTNTEWKPGCIPPEISTPVSQQVESSVKSSVEIHQTIVAQGILVRDLKSQKAPKPEIDTAVQKLLSLKNDYKVLTKVEWKPDCVPSTETHSLPVQKNEKTATSVNEAIISQGDTVRILKAQKAAKVDIERAVQELLALKAEYKTLTNIDWKPGCVPPSEALAAEATEVKDIHKTALTTAEINQTIIIQGDLVRNLKAQKASKPEIDTAVQKLLTLKADYKALTNIDWKPGCVPPSETKSEIALPGKINSDTKSAVQVNEEIINQGNIVRNLKTSKASKVDIDVAIKTLLSLKAEYKTLTSVDWKPGCAPPNNVNSAKVRESVTTVQNCEESFDLKPAMDVHISIIEKESEVRNLENEMRNIKAKFDAATKALQTLKTEKVDSPPIQNNVEDKSTESADEIHNKIVAQGDKIRILKAAKSEKVVIDAEVKILLNLKNEYKQITGSDWKPVGNSASKDNSKTSKSKEDKAAKQKKVSAPKEKKSIDADESNALKKQTRLGLEAKKEEDLPEWYSQIIIKGELIEYGDISGCYILRPWSYAIWEVISSWFDGKIKKLGVKNGYFPIFVSRNALEKEKTHIADFSPEVAWVTKSGDSEMAEPVAIRPTSETVMYPAYAKWIQSYRDLPIKINQWNNVVRWEFKHPQPFLRTREFLWQEGHTAYANKEEACEEVSTILDLYAKVYTDLLAIPVIKGRKTEKEKFAGGDYTLTIEAFVPATGRGIQAATSHHLGQNFSKMFEITYDDPKTQEKTYVYQNSWGITTRTIGVMVMVHGDNQGLVLPPRVATIQVVIVPCGVSVNLTDADRNDLQRNCDIFEEELKKAGIRVEGDYRDYYSPGWKFNHWELKGVPIRIELGPKDIKNKQVVAVRRDTGQKTILKRETCVKDISSLLEDIQQSLFNKASEEYKNHTVQLNDWKQFTPTLDKKNVILAPYCGENECEDKIKADSTRDASEVVEVGAPSMGAKSLCIPLEQPPLKANTKCIHPECKNNAKFYTLFGRSY